MRNENVAVTSKSPKAVARAALVAAQRVLPFYTHPNSPKKFTQHQLFACLVLKNFLKTDYRGVVAHLADHPEAARGAAASSSVPHFTTLQKASRHLLACEPVRRVLESTIRHALRPPSTSRIVGRRLDRLGMHGGQRLLRAAATVASSLPWKTVVYHRYPKLGLVCDTSCHFILARSARRPRTAARRRRAGAAARSGALRSMLLECLIADAGYDSESNHRFARERCGIRTLIPAKHGRPTTKPASGRYRRLMQTRFDVRRTTIAPQSETVMSMIKRGQGPFARGRTYPHSAATSA